MADIGVGRLGNKREMEKPLLFPFEQLAEIWPLYLCVLAGARRRSPI
jgi:hypothetical protein